MWPKGLCDEIAVIDESFERIENATGVKFSEDFDDLDQFKFHIFKNAGGFFALMRYLNSPNTGLVLIAEEGNHKSVKEKVDFFLKSFNMEGFKISWLKDQD